MTRAGSARRPAPATPTGHAGDTAALLALLQGQRWFGEVETVESARISAVPVENGPLRVVVVDVRRAGHTAEHVTLVLGPDAAADALTDPELVRRLAALAGVETPCRSVRSVEGEQSNSSVVLDERHVLKLYRRLEAGPAPEVELLRALTAHGSANVPALEGALETGSPPVPTTLCSVTAFVPSLGDGWTLALDSLATDPGWLPDRAHRLGVVTASLHRALGGLDGAGLAPVEPPADGLDEVARRLGDGLADTLAAVSPGSEGAPLAAQVGDLRALAARYAAGAADGLWIRAHGDYHLGQVLWTTGGDWVAIDLEGEPGRSLAERRERRSPLRDVAGMLRSFAYVADAAPRLRGARVPEGWLDGCRAAFLAGYLDNADGRLLPARGEAVERVLALFELEKLAYELRYELRHRPAWVGIPVAGLRRLLSEGT